MKDRKREPQKDMRSLEPGEMLRIRGGIDKPVRPKSPDEVVIMI